MRGQKLLTITLGVSILVSLCSSIAPNSTETSLNESKEDKATKKSLREKLSEMAKEFGATSFEETSEEMSSAEETPVPVSLAPKQHVKRLASTEQQSVEFQEYQGVMGRPGVDFPVLPSIPKTSFSCRQVKSSGYYADLDTDCQVFHICADGRKISFLCPNGTIFRQSHLICDWWWTVDCASSREHYEESAEMLANDQKIYQARSDALSKSRDRQRSNRKPGIIREHESTSASVNSFNRQFPSSTYKPNENEDVYQAAGSMEQAEQRQVHAFHPPFPAVARSRRPITGQLPEGRQTSQSKIHVETKPSVHNVPHLQNKPSVQNAPSFETKPSVHNVPQLENKPSVQNIPRFDVKPSVHNVPHLRNFKQNVPPAPEQRKLSPSLLTPTIQTLPFTEVNPILNTPIVTTHHPQFFNNREFGQNFPVRQSPQSRKISPSRFSLSTQQIPVNQHPSLARQNNQQPLQNNPPARPVQFRPESQVFSGNKDTNNTRTYTHFRLFPPSDKEHQVPAESGSFVNNRNNIQTSTQKTKQRITPVPQNRVPQSTTKSYVELNRTKTGNSSNTEKSLDVALSKRVKPIKVQVTDRGRTGVSKKDDEDENTATENIPFEDEEDDDFSELAPEDDIEDIIKLDDADETDIDLDKELGLFKPPSDVQFKVEDLGNSQKETKAGEEHDSSTTTQDTPVPEMITESPDREEESSNEDFNVTSIDISTKRNHRFSAASTSVTTSISPPSESQSVPLISSTLEPPIWNDSSDEEVPVVKETYKITKEAMEDEGTTTTMSTTILDKNTSTERYSPSESSISEIISQSTSSSTATEAARRKVTPVFVEIISRGSSAPPLLKKFTVEELEKKYAITESPVSTKGTTSSITSTESTTKARFRSRTTTESVTSKEEPTVSASQATPSKRVRLPKQEMNGTAATLEMEKSTKPTTPIPPTTLYVTLSRRVQPPILILSSTDPREKSKEKNSTNTSRSKAPQTRKKSASERQNAFSLSRRVQPPLLDINTTTSPSTTSQSIQNLTTSTIQSLNIEADQLPLEEDAADQQVKPTESATSSTRKSTTYVEIQRRKSTTTEVSSTSTLTTIKQTTTKKPKTTASIATESSSENVPPNRTRDTGSSIRNTVTVAPEKSLPLIQEPTPMPQFGNRDGLDIPASSGPSTLHTLAVYFATKEGETETTSPTFESTFDSKKQRGMDMTTTVSTPLTASTTERSPSSSSDAPVEAPPGFLTQLIRESYSSLFHVSNTTARPSHKSKGTDISPNTLRTELLDKLAEISQMESTPTPEERGKVSRRPAVRTDTEDLLQGTDSRDLRELAQIFSRALSKYLENPEQFKKVLTEVRPQDPIPIDKNQTEDVENKDNEQTTLNPHSTYSKDYFSSSNTDEEEEVLDFSDVSKLTQKKTKSTTRLPSVYKSTRSPEQKKTVSTTVTTPTTSVASSSVRDNEDAAIKPSKESLQSTQSNYYAATKRYQKSGSEKSEEVAQADNSLSTRTSPKYTDEDGAPTAGGVNDPSRPRYGGFQNNTRRTASSNNEAKVEAPASKKRVETTTVKPAQTRTTRVSVTMGKTTDVTVAIAGILNTFVPQDVNNLAITVDNSDIQSNRQASSKSKSGKSLTEESSRRSNPSRGQQTKNTKNQNESDGTLDPLTINRELSASNADQVSAATSTTKRPSTTNGKMRSRNKSTTNTPTTSPIPTSSTSSKSTTQEMRKIAETQDKDSSWNSEEQSPTDVSDNIYYSEKIKPPPLISASQKKDPVSSTFGDVKITSTSRTTTTVPPSEKISFQDNKTLPLEDAVKSSKNYSNLEDRGTDSSQKSSKYTEAAKETSKEDTEGKPRSSTEATTKNLQTRKQSSKTNTISSTITTEPSSTTSGLIRRSKSTTPASTSYDDNLKDNLQDDRERNSTSVSTKPAPRSGKFGSRTNPSASKQAAQAMFPKIRMTNDSSEISRLEGSSEISLNIDDVTSEQLQALEDLQTMIFPHNATMSEDGSMFGNLNQSSTLSLINTMKMAVTNSTVRHLVLLLVNSLKENTPEETRKQLIEALLKIPMDHTPKASRRQSVLTMAENGGKSEKSSRSVQKGTTLNESDKKQSLSSKTSKLATQSKTSDNKPSESEAKPASTTQPPFRTRTRKTQSTSRQRESTTPVAVTSSATTTVSTTVPTKSQRQSKLRTVTETTSTTTTTTSSIVEDVYRDLATEADTLPPSDSRAVELLRSLYSLASRWG